MSWIARLGRCEEACQWKTSLSTKEEAQRLDFEVLYLLQVEDAE
ncbi:hypothetical protein [Sinorhizobium meliloti]|nr:hypothetical protein [Sinorhizobium meliloti]WGI72969.1 hypothetical protein QC756_11360 [Sinorhizobium meliloti]